MSERLYVELSYEECMYVFDVFAEEINGEKFHVTARTLLNIENSAK